MPKLYNRARVTVSSTGTGTLTLSTAVAGYQTFTSAGVQNNDVVSYVVEDGLNWECGTGTFNSSANTLTRTVTQSYNGTTYGTSPISVTSSAQVFISPLAADILVATNLGTGVATALGNATNAANGIVTLNSNQNASISGAVAMGSSFVRNRLINPSFDFWQRGTSFTDMGATTTYTADRWSCYRFGYAAGITVSQVTGLSQNGNNRIALRLQRTSGNTSTAVLYATQSIETLLSRDLAGKSVTISFWARAGANYSSSGSALSVAVNTGTGTDEAVRNTFTGSASPISTSVTLTTSFQRFSATGTLSSTTNEIAVVFSFTPTGTAGAADNVDIMDVQLEEGSIATAFEKRPIEQELALCQRFYQKSIPLSTSPGSSGTNNMCQFFIGANTTGWIYMPIIFPVTMRGSPTVVAYDSTGASGKVEKGATGKTAAYADAREAGVNIGTQDATSANYLAFYYTAAAEL